MAKVVFPAELQRYAGGAVEVEVSAGNYRDLVAELCRRFPALTEEAIGKQAIAIDGMIIHSPLLESFSNDSELVFFAKIAGG
jgi:molybdopterin converting factor small subunit